MIKFTNIINKMQPELSGFFGGYFITNLICDMILMLSQKEIAFYRPYSSIIGGIVGIILGYQFSMFYFDQKIHWNPKHWVRFSTAYHVGFFSMVEEQTVDEWCRNNCRGNYLLTNTMVLFNRKTDATLFKIFFGL